MCFLKYELNKYNLCANWHGKLHETNVYLIEKQWKKWNWTVCIEVEGRTFKMLWIELFGGPFNRTKCARRAYESRSQNFENLLEKIVWIFQISHKKFPKIPSNQSFHVEKFNLKIISLEPLHLQFITQNWSHNKKGNT